jgi:galactan endo-1,6-beta-galactosidase
MKQPLPQGPLTRRALLALLSFGVPLLASLGAVSAESTVTVNPSADWGIWQGWGCSLAWWANVFGSRDDIADILFTTKSAVLNGGILPGLGLTIARYNAGGCSPKTVDGSVMQVSPHIPAFKQIQGYWQDSSSADPASASWDWTVDANQRLMLQKARDRGASHFELFSNSPMWWMCRSLNPSGADNGADDNLLPANLHRHAVYLASIAKYAADHWGIRFDSVEAFNEPSAGWWNSRGTQEGCHFDAAVQAVVIAALREELDSRGLPKMKVAASDENTYDDAFRTWNSFRPAIQAQVGRVNVHGYQYGGGRRDLLFQATRPTELWNSEYGEGDGSGMPLAANLALDLRYLHPTAWCYWQPLDGGGWGLIQSDPGHNQIGAVNPKYFVLAQYSRHIRPGMTILDGGDDSTTAAYDHAAHKLVLVTVSSQAGQWVTYDLSHFRSVSGPVTCWATDTRDGGERYIVRHDIRLSGKKIRAWLGPNSVHTFEVQAVR